ncbi:late promoter transcription accessory protein [Candidatus Dojkabacteria bacterium]|jgi:hypothetical protein|nr:late promoter transcription accessory protein [Candidatus Dojkabacteria bacterium]
MPTKDEVAKFSMTIDSYVLKTGYNYIEGVVEYCKESGLELEVAASLISPNLKSKIESDAIRRNLIKDKGARLPI